MSMKKVYHEVRLATAVDLNSVADVTGGGWGPGLVPHRIHAVALVVTNALGAAGVLKFDKRPTYGSDTNRGDGDVAVLNLPSGAAIGAIIYKDGLDVLINPGEQVVPEVTDATAASDTGDIYMYVEPVYEHPSNIDAMTESA